TRVVTPGTLTEDDLLDPREHNHLVALAPAGSGHSGRSVVGVAWVELSTGVFQAADVARDRLVDELTRLAPSECLLGEMASAAEAAPVIERVRASVPGLTVTPRPDWTFDPSSARPALDHPSGATPRPRSGARQDAVEELVEEHSLRQALRAGLGAGAALQRLTARVSTGRATPRDLAAVRRTLAGLPRIKARVAARRSALLRELESRL